MPCQACGRNVPTKYFEYYQNIGMLIMRSMRSVKGNMCKRCARRYFWEMTGLTLVTGWWGMISLIINPFLIIQNIVRACSTIGMADGSTGGFPVGGPKVDVKVPPLQNPKFTVSDASNPYRQDM